MKRRTKQILGGMAVALGAAGALVLKRRRPRLRRAQNAREQNVWARPGMTVTFRAELMPGREASERSFRIAELLPSGRVTLDGVSGEHAETEFERVR
jgi:hypothetical protein